MDANGGVQSRFMGSDLGHGRSAHTPTELGAFRHVQHGFEQPEEIDPRCSQQRHSFRLASWLSDCGRALRQAKAFREAVPNREAVLRLSEICY